MTTALKKHYGIVNAETTRQLTDRVMALLEQREQYRKHLVASERARLRTTGLLDADYERIAGWVNQRFPLRGGR